MCSFIKYNREHEHKLDLNSPNSGNGDNTRQETNETFHTKSVAPSMFNTNTDFFFLQSDTMGVVKAKHFMVWL